MDPLKTQFDLREIVERCFSECEEAGYIIREHATEPNSLPKRVLLNEQGVADHISKTIIGELMEFEVLRKLGPMFTQFRSIEKDMIDLTNRHAIESGYANLRISQK